MVLLQSSILSLHSIVCIDTNSKLVAVKLHPPPYYKRNFVKGFYSDFAHYFAFVFCFWGSRHTNRTRSSNHDCPQRGKIKTDLLLRGLQLVPCTKRIISLKKQLKEIDSIQLLTAIVLTAYLL